MNDTKFFKNQLDDLDVEIQKETKFLNSRGKGNRYSEKLERLKEERAEVYKLFLASHKRADRIIMTFMECNNGE